MDSILAGLIVGTLGVGLIGWGVQKVSRRCAGQPSELPAQQPLSEEALCLKTKQVYNRLMYIRLAGFALCLLAGVLLYMKAGSIPALLFAGAGCGLQFTAFRVRTRHVMSVTGAGVHTASAEKSSAKPFPDVHAEQKDS